MQTIKYSHEQLYSGIEKIYISFHYLYSTIHLFWDLFEEKSGDPYKGENF